jgi:hypothetical protein
MDDRDLLTGTLRSLFAQPDVDVPAALDDLGWAEVAADDPAGATTLLFTEHGRALARSNILDQVVLAALPLDPGVARAVLYPPIGSAFVTGEGVLLPGSTTAVEVVVPVLDGLSVVSGTAVDARTVDGFDPGCGWSLARLADDPAPTHAAGTWVEAVAAGRRALAAELNGITGVILETAVQHTSERFQYGRAIASYQSVRHRLAEGHSSLEASRSLLAGAFADGSEWAATAAKAQAGEAYREVARHAMQVCGAIGLSYEHRLHRYVRRGALLDGLLGSSRDLTREMGARLLEGYRAPSVVDL